MGLGGGSRWWESAPHPPPPVLQSGQGQPPLPSLCCSCSITCLQLPQGHPAGWGGPKPTAMGTEGPGTSLPASSPTSWLPVPTPPCWGCGEGAVIQLYQPQPGPACGCCGFGAGEGGRSAAALCWEMRAEGGAGGRELSADGAGTALGSCGDAAAHRLPDAAKGKKGSPHGFLHCIRVTARPRLRCKGTCCYWGGALCPVPCRALTVLLLSPGQ